MVNPLSEHRYLLHPYDIDEAMWTYRDLACLNFMPYRVLLDTRDACVGLRLVRHLSGRNARKNSFQRHDQTLKYSIFSVIRETAKGNVLLSTGDLQGAHSAFSMAILAQSSHNGARLGLAKTLRLETNH